MSRPSIVAGHAAAGCLAAGCLAAGCLAAGCLAAGYSFCLVLSQNEWVKQFEGSKKALGIISFPGTAAPQCGISSEQTEANRSEEKATRGGTPAAICPTSTLNTLRQHVTEHPAGSCLVEALEGILLGKIVLSWKNAAA
ncbi:MAG: hypothetical protein NTV14_01345 [Coprothermobacterota bacterium]|nr:hypothetical protein [Coprothermobacterota bacterium]